MRQTRWSMHIYIHLIPSAHLRIFHRRWIWLLLKVLKLLGSMISYTTDGYSEWAEACVERKLFPLFNIEYISLKS